MSYEPTNWKTGDVVTSEKLNKLENGVANGYLVVHAISKSTDTKQTSTLDRTFKDIFDTLNDGRIAVIMRTGEDGGTSFVNIDLITNAASNAEETQYSVYVGAGGTEYICSAPDEYPAIEMGVIVPGGSGGDINNPGGIV